MKNKTVFLLCILLSASFSLAMSGFKKDNDVPVPADNYRAILLDRAGIVTNGHHFSIEGDTFVRSKMGKVTLFVDFKDLKKVTFSNHDEKFISAVFTLTNGKEFEGQVNGGLTLFGQADFGKFKVRLRELVSIEVHSGK